MHDDGEVDVRGTYTALAVAALFNVLTPELVEGAAAYALRCQTYEGGFGGEPGVEAHGGYVFCALAALVILGHYFEELLAEPAPFPRSLTPRRFTAADAPSWTWWFKRRHGWRGQQQWGC